MSAIPATATSRALGAALSLLLAWAPLLLPARGFAASARVQYMSSTNVYLDAGSRAGLAEGMQVEVERDGQVIGELIVEFVAQNSASCRVQSSSQPLRPGDVVTFTPALPPASEAGMPVQAEPPRFWSRLGVLHGRLGLLYLQSQDASGTYTNPVLSAYVGWRGPKQRELSLRFRGDNPGNDIPGVTTSRDTRLYEASLVYRGPNERFELEAGRLLAERLELLGAMDGGGLHWRPTRSWRIGVAGGTGADYSSIGFAVNGWKLGGFVETGERGGLWRAVLSGGQIEDPDLTRRRYLQLRGDARPHRILRFYENLELDFSPDWKRNLGAPSVELTALSFGAQAWLHRTVDASVGYEARRPLLDPSQRQLPVILPRDLLHSLRGSARFRLASQWSLRVGGDVRLNAEDAVDMHSWDAWVQGSRVGPLALSLHGSVYDSWQSRGKLLDGHVSWDAGNRTRLDASAGSSGTRTNRDIAGGSEPELRWGWVRFGASLDAGRGFWLDGAAEWRGNDQGHEFHLQLAQLF